MAQPATLAIADPHLGSLCPTRTREMEDRFVANRAEGFDGQSGNIRGVLFNGCWYLSPQTLFAMVEDAYLQGIISPAERLTLLWETVFSLSEDRCENSAEAQAIMDRQEELLKQNQLLSELLDDSRREKELLKNPEFPHEAKRQYEQLCRDFTDWQDRDHAKLLMEHDPAVGEFASEYPTLLRDIRDAVNAREVLRARS